MRKDVVHTLTYGYNISVQITVTSGCRQNAMKSGFQCHRCLAVRKTGGRPMINDFIVLDPCLVSGKIGHNADGIGSMAPEIAEGKIQSFDFFGRSADCTNECIVRPHHSPNNGSVNSVAVHEIRKQDNGPERHRYFSFRAALPQHRTQLQAARSRGRLFRLSRPK